MLLMGYSCCLTPSEGYNRHIVMYPRPLCHKMTQPLRGLFLIFYFSSMGCHTFVLRREKVICKNMRAFYHSFLLRILSHSYPFHSYYYLLLLTYVLRILISPATKQDMLDATWNHGVKELPVYLVASWLFSSKWVSSWYTSEIKP